MASVALKKLNPFAPYKKVLKKAKRVANIVDKMKFVYRNMSNEELSRQTIIFRERLSKGESLDNFLPQALATAREAVWRTKRMFAFKVQLIAAAVMHFGDFAELFTGEGKTLVCVLCLYVNALTKRGCHIVTVNEYLVKRDATFCAECLNPLGITVGYNSADFEPDEKRKNFACDITYTSNSELGFDYLRDNMVENLEDKVIRGLEFAIVDEGDSVLIDEARTPLLIAGQGTGNPGNFLAADKFVKTLTPDDYKTDPESNTVFLNQTGVKKAEEYFKLPNFYNIENSDLIHKIRNALMANYIFQLGVQYIVKDDEILLVDTNTGRVMEGRSYSAGLQQAIQAKERVEIDPEGVTAATITYQSFFRLYKKLAGCSGTAFTEDEEFLKIYNLVVVPIPPNKPVIRKDRNDYIFENKATKWAHVVAAVEKIHAKGQPVLIGTNSVEDSEQLAYYFRNKGLQFEILNAKNHAREAEIVSHAGEKGAITISTNMAGRGTDIKLGPGVEELGGLYVIGTDRNESRRIDNQLKGRSGRQGNPGETRFFISLQDELFRRFAVEKIDKSNDKITDTKYDSWFFTKMVNNAQKKIEGFNFDSRKNLIDYDGVLSNQRNLIYKQRDDILSMKRNSAIIKNMTQYVAREMINANIDNENENYINHIQITNMLNSFLFKNIPVLSPNYFKFKTLDDAKQIIMELLGMSIDVRLALIHPDVREKTIKSILIQNLDHNWSEHISKVTKIREGVQLRSLEQKSPLNIFVEEADTLFNMLKVNIARTSIIALHRIYMPEYNRIMIENIKKTTPSMLQEGTFFNPTTPTSFSSSGVTTDSTIETVPGGSIAIPANDQGNSN